MTRRIALYTDKKYRAGDEYYLPMLIPYWGKWTKVQKFQNIEMHYTGVGESLQIDKEMSVFQDYFDIVDSIEEADAALLPTNLIRYYQMGIEHVAHELADLAAEHQKPIIIFGVNDLYVPFERGNVIRFGASLYQSKLKPNEFAAPPWIPDYREGRVSLREKGEKPVVGFCGRVKDMTPGNIMRHEWRRVFQEFYRVDFAGSYKGKDWELKQADFLRPQALELLEKHDKVETDFITREGSYGDVQRKVAGQDEFDNTISASIGAVRKVYYQNMLNTDYNLCLRGKGNYSFRFYETLSHARIPLFIDTDCVLPYDFAIDWKKQMFWMDVKDMKHVGDRLYEWHSGLSNDDFLQLQKNARELWVEWLTPNGFFKNFYRFMERAKF